MTTGRPYRDGMDDTGIRERATRRADTLRRLTTPALDGWVATSSPEGVPYLVPLSVVWADERLVIALDAGSRTARNLAAVPTARLGLGPTRDVVLIDAVVERIVPTGDDAALGAAYAAQADWDPRTADGYEFIVLRPTRIQSWRESNEIPGRTVMRDGSWLE